MVLGGYKMLRMARVFGVLAVILFFAGTTHAASNDVKKTPDWSDPYIGVFVAHSWLDLEYYEPDWPGYERNPNINTFTGGVYLGFNYPINNIVMGIETDAGFGDMSKGPDDNSRNYYSAFDIDWTMHLRSRIGWLFGPALPYISGGLSLTEINLDDSETGWGRDDNLHVGWTIGAGIEHAVTKKLKARIEYLYDDYGREHYYIDGLLPYRANIDLTSHTVRAGLSYSF
jgi:outer membrane immunogenic protein